MNDPTNDNDIDALLRRIERYDLFGFKGHGDMLYRLANALVYLDAQAHSMQRAEARASIADMRDLVIPIGKTLSDAKAALTALVAERDELKERVEQLKQVNTTAVTIISERDALRKRLAELESQPPAASDLRERLVCAALNGILSEQRGLLNHEYALRAIGLADATLAAMRKGDSDGK